MTLKRVIRRAIRRARYTIERPSFWRSVDIDPQEVIEARDINRATLAKVSCWIRDVDYQNAIYQYGLPSSVRTLIDEPTTSEITYSDVICAFARRAKPSLRYLEIGVSVGKNFAQVVHCVKGADLVGFDIEDINPVLEEMLEKSSEETWVTAEESLRKRPSVLANYTSRSGANKIQYLAGDVFDTQSWDRLRGRTFNVVFSDAFHTGDALKKEWAMIRSLGLLAPEGFIMFWDDLGGYGMRKAFYGFADDIRKSYGADRVTAGLNFFNGWLGEKVPYHPVGFLRLSPP